jgi:hypothetical protein
MISFALLLRHLLLRQIFMRSWWRGDGVWN